MIRLIQTVIRPYSEAVSSSISLKSWCSLLCRNRTSGSPVGCAIRVTTQRSFSQMSRSGSRSQVGQGLPPSPARGSSSAGGGSTFGAIEPSTTSQGKTSQSTSDGAGRRPLSPAAATTLA
ncbi:hypothetical protein [Nocardioides ungokensis]|uniref:hypothetical protein n=1 Tax=Nocardioides ungokensis TaxID=1643322 RepID=UPI0015DD92DB|nr:hypothetical protein [Nocardioides ungokensis]